MLKFNIKIVIEDITKVPTEAIVNVANKSLLGGGGVDGAIHRAAGPELLTECITLNGCKTGNAKITKGYKLPAKYVIHTVGPIRKEGKHNEKTQLRNCYKNALKLVIEYNIKSVAFSAISTGVYRFPFELATKIAMNEITNFLKEFPDVEITISCFEENIYHAYLDEYKNIQLQIQ